MIRASARSWVRSGRTLHSTTPCCYSRAITETTWGRTEFSERILCVCPAPNRTRHFEPHAGFELLTVRADDEAVRVPFIMHWPARIPPTRPVKLVAASVDVWPTLAGLLGLSPPRPTEGVDMSPLIPLMREGLVGPAAAKAATCTCTAEAGVTAILMGAPVAAWGIDGR